MKKLRLIATIVLLTGTLKLFAAHPIPSYNVQVTNRANFQEMTQNNSQAKEKRIMNIQTNSVTMNSASGSVSVVFVYKLNGHKRLGPYYLECGDQLSVEIDNSKWGVVMELQSPWDPVLASVWIGQGSVTK
jgi:hypothetical protein